MTNSYFPILIKYTDDCSQHIVQHPQQIISGLGFKVLKTNVK